MRHRAAISALVAVLGVISHEAVTATDPQQASYFLRRQPSGEEEVALISAHYDANVSPHPSLRLWGDPPMSSVGLGRRLVSLPIFAYLSSLFDCHQPGFQVLETIPHDCDAFTQGLTFDPNNPSMVYESTGLYGQSDVRKVDIQTGEATTIQSSPSSIFGEGLAYYTTSASERRLIHLTWKSRTGYIIDADNLQTLQEFQFSTQRNEGWGVTYNPTTDQFIVTDGSNYLHLWDAGSLTETGRIAVTSSSSPVNNLNEIEWDSSTQTVLANVWQTNSIVRIDPTTGDVTNTYDLSSLYTCRVPTADVLNGIAISPSGDVWVTGKKWPSMYRIRLID